MQLGNAGERIRFDELSQDFSWISPGEKFSGRIGAASSQDPVGSAHRAAHAGGSGQESHLQRAAESSEHSSSSKRMLQAAVLALIGQQEASAPTLLFTQRAAGIRQGGQVSFPGGGREPGENPEQTALRETREEIGIGAEHIDVLGRVPSRQFTRLRVDVVPVVGRWREDQSLIVPSAAEVERVLIVPVEQLAAPENRFTWVIGNGHHGPGFRVAGAVIWGMTAAITDALLAYFGWERAWDSARVEAVPPEFR
ncbi:MAG: CoA pyrophosphatase [Arcanobacterium sp.]|nr:CoA pyrophosphatase [Arcanobacterium sp.]